MSLRLKLCASLILLTTSLAVTVYANDYKTVRGTYVTGYNAKTETVLLSDIMVKYDAELEDAALAVDRTGVMEAIKTGSKIAAYATNPKKYFYYELNLKPQSENGLIVSEKTGSTTSQCALSANAILTAFKGDGTKTTFCVTLK